MKRSFRLKKSADFERVRRQGKSFPHPLIVLIALPNDLPLSRYAVVAGKRFGKAVQRNRAKRVIRAVLQNHLSEINPGWDLILIARQPMAEANYMQIHEAILNTLDRAQLTTINK